MTATPSTPSSLDCLGYPEFHAHRLEQFPDQVLELHRLEREQVRAAVQPGDDVHLLDELELLQVELQDWLDWLQVVGVLRDQGVEVAAQARLWV